MAALFASLPGALRGTRELADRCGFKMTTPWKELTEAQRRAYVLADNRLAHAGHHRDVHVRRLGSLR